MSVAKTPRPSRWAWVTIESQRLLTFVYVDPMAGLSAKGGYVSTNPSTEEIVNAVDMPDNTVRLAGGGFHTVEMTDEEVQGFNLPARPPWMSVFDEGRPWRTDPKLATLLHPDHPDSAPAKFFFPETQSGEVMWVSLDSTFTGPGGQTGYSGELLNTPNSPSQLKSGSQVTIRSIPGQSMPIYMEPHMWTDLRDWSLSCESCACDVHFIPVATIASAQFPDAPEGCVPVQFTTRCPLCSETMMVARIGQPA